MLIRVVNFPKRHSKFQFATIGCLTALATKSDLYPPVISSGNGQSLINDDLYGQMAFPLPFLITRGDVTFCG